jgi:hypothetical protein
MNPAIETASVKVMRSHDYCHFEVSLSSSSANTPELVDELRKTAARLADKAVSQYRIAKNNASRLLSEKYERDAVIDNVKRYREIPELERTVKMQAAIKAFDDATWEAGHRYDYEDEWSDDQDN